MVFLMELGEIKIKFLIYRVMKIKNYLKFIKEDHPSIKESAQLLLMTIEPPIITAAFLPPSAPSS